MATSTYMTFLMHKSADAGDWEKLLDITEFPDLGGDPEMIDVTTLSPQDAGICPRHPGNGGPYVRGQL